ncbi:hypothetical protein AB0C51_11020 [Streptomyces pathocidini]|uniref:hypothetical protein n=1 Tax=Streptomyces pathocidini TaxID=1650571 RepID=UPI0033C03658
MRDEALLRDVLAELGDDRVQELAGELGTGPEGAREVVGATVAALPASVGDGSPVGVLSKLTGPTAQSVAELTGLPLPAVTRALELLLPVILSVIGERRRDRP